MPAGSLVTLHLTQIRCQKLKIRGFDVNLEDDPGDAGTTMRNSAVIRCSQCYTRCFKLDLKQRKNERKHYSEWLEKSSSSLSYKRSLHDEAQSGSHTARLGGCQYWTPGPYNLIEGNPFEYSEHPISAISATEVFETGIQARYVGRCVVCGTNQRGILHYCQCHIIPKVED